MSKPNAHFRNREIGWVNGAVWGNGGAISHGARGALGAGVTSGALPFQVNHAILGGASVLFVDQGAGVITIFPSSQVVDVHDSHAVYMEVFAHLRNGANIDLPGVIHVFFNELPAPTMGALGDWAVGRWQEWEDWSPLTVPTPPPSSVDGGLFHSAGAVGARYEYRRVLGRIPGNLFFLQLTNAGTTTASEWGIGVMLRSSPPVYTR